MHDYLFSVNGQTVLSPCLSHGRPVDIGGALGAKAPQNFRPFIEIKSDQMFAVEFHIILYTH
jgi:hypothetical protein